MIDEPDNVFTSPLLLAATPIGNDFDASPRLLQAFRQAEIIAAEDTRRARLLLQRLDLQFRAQLVALHDHNEEEQSAWIISQCQEGKQVLFISDAGMPAISDPGYRLVQKAIKAGLDFSVLPGPSAPLVALVASGLPTQSFTFVGFPSRGASLSNFLSPWRSHGHTLIFFESPRRLLNTLEVFISVFGPERPVAICRELTKKHEEVLRGSLKEVHKILGERDSILGEIVIVLGPGGSSNANLDLALDQMVQMVQAGLKTKEAAKLAAKFHDLRPNQVFEAFLASRNA